MFSLLSSFWRSLFASGRKRAEKRAAAEAALLDTDDVRSVGPLLEALWLGDKMLRLQAEQALIRLLPRLHSRDAYLLSPERRECLNRALNHKNPHLALAAIKATEEVGDSSALPILERMAHKSATSHREERLRQTAIECLNLVEARVQRNRVPSTLLRPAREPMHSEQLLLASQAPGVPSSARRLPGTNKRKG